MEERHLETLDVTVLIPCNDIRYLSQCFESISDQSIAPKLVLVVLNGDAAKISQEQIRELRSVLNCECDFYISPEDGIVSALNYGLKFVNTKYLARLDADDLFTGERLEKQISFLESHQDYVAVGGQVVEYHSNKRRIAYPLDHDEIFTSLFRFSSLPHPGVTFRMSAVKMVGQYSNDFNCVEDWELWIRLAKVGKLANLESIVLRYRIHDLQVTNSEASRKMSGQVKLTKARFWRSVRNFSNECCCKSCQESRSEVFGRTKHPKSILMSIRVTTHGLNYSVSCLAGYFYVLGKRLEQKNFSFGLVITGCCAVLRPNWAFSAFLRRLASQSTGH